MRRSNRTSTTTVDRVGRPAADKHVKLLITGGAGFIGTNLVSHLLDNSRHEVVNLDVLGYPANRDALADLENHVRHHFVHGDINDADLLRALLQEHRPQAVIHLAAHTHVDRSIAAPAAFLRNNVEGTFTLLETTREHWRSLAPGQRATFRFIHVSTDEVYGGPQRRIDEATSYDPHSPYAASKAAADFFVKACRHTYGFPAVVTHPCNNYGPHQFAEKLIPHTIACALGGKHIPVYGDGTNVRDWLHVTDHARALLLLLESPLAADEYLIGADNPRRNLEVVQRICTLLDEHRSRPSGHHGALISHVADRAGHDLHYHVDAGRLRSELGWRPLVDFEQGLADTVHWYVKRFEAGLSGAGEGVAGPGETLETNPPAS